MRSGATSPSDPDAVGAVTVEACVTSVAEALDAVNAGADRLELCVRLDVGGLTPPAELVGTVARTVPVPVFVLVRPRAGDFRARSGELETMVASVRDARVAGAQGVVVGLLDSEEAIDRAGVAGLVAAAGELPLTFHRAFDEVVDPLASIETLAELGVARVLTAGGPGTAWEGRAMLRRLARAVAGAVSVVAGGRVRGDHVRALIAETGVREVHARAQGIPGVCRALGRSAAAEATS